MYDVCRKKPCENQFYIQRVMIDYMRRDFIAPARQITLSGAGDRSKMAAPRLVSANRQKRSMRRLLFIRLCPQHSGHRLQCCHVTRTSGVGGKSARDRKFTLFERCPVYVVLSAVIAVDKETPKCSFIPSQRT